MFRSVYLNSIDLNTSLRTRASHTVKVIIFVKLMRNFSINSHFLNISRPEIV